MMNQKMDKLTIWIAYEKDYAEYRYILWQRKRRKNIKKNINKKLKNCKPLMELKA